MGRQRQRFLHLHQIDAACLEHRALPQIDLVHHQFGVEPILDLGARAGQKASAQPVGGVAEAQV